MSPWSCARSEELPCPACRSSCPWPAARPSLRPVRCWVAASGLQERPPGLFALLPRRPCHSRFGTGSSAYTALAEGVSTCERDCRTSSAFLPSVSKPCSPAKLPQRKQLLPASALLHVDDKLKAARILWGQNVFTAP